MGQIIAQTQQKCCSTYYYNKLKQEDEGEQERQMANIQKDHDYFFQQDWFAKSKQMNFDPEKFIYIYYDYKQDQMEMEKYWSKVNLQQEIKHGFIERQGNEVLQLKWKYLLRRGVPMDKMRTLILDIFKKTYENNDQEYKTTTKVVFKGQEPVSFKHIPIFQDSNLKIQEVLSVQVLNEEGIQALGKICWTLKQTFYQIQYNPMVVQIANLMLIFLTDAETFCILHFMLEDSAKLLNEKEQDSTADQQRSLRWHFMMNKNQFERLGKSFYDTVSNKSQTFKQILTHFQKIGFNYNEFFADMVNNLFLGYLHLPAVLKLFILFLNEGIKIYLRMSYALCFMLKDEILANKDPSCMKNLIKNNSLKLNKKQIKALINKGFSLRLTSASQKLSRYSIKNEDRSTRIFYLPLLKTQSKIVTQGHLEGIWDYIPNYLKMTDPSLIFSTEQNGFSLNQLYQRAEQYQECPAIFFIKTSKGDIFGFYIEQNLKSASQMQYYGTDEIFLFQLHPKEEYYKSTGANQCHIYSEKDYFSLGSSQDQTKKNSGVALQLDNELNKGITYNCETYDSPPLTSNQSTEFQLVSLEVYAFISECDL